MMKRFSSTVLCGVLVLANWPLALLAKPRKLVTTPTPPVVTAATPAATPEVAGSAHLRLWKACDSKDNAALQIRWLPSKGSFGKGVDVATNADRYQFTSYEDVPAGAGVLQIASAGQPAVQLGANLAKDQNCTLLVRVYKGVPSAELLDDTPPSGSAAPAFSVFNLLFGGKGEVVVAVGDALTAHLNAAGGTLQAQGIKPAFYQITVNGTDNDGQALRWNTETDLRKVHRATLIICPDAYGRIRPRLIEDGAAGETKSGGNE